MKVNTPVTQKERDFPKSANILSTTDLKGQITYVNKDFIDISGFTEDELIGKNHNIVRHPDMPPAAFKMLWNDVKSDKSWMGVVKNRCKNGDHYWVNAYVTPIKKDGRVDEYQSVRRKATRAEIQRAEKIYPKLMQGKTPPELKTSMSTRVKVLLCIMLPFVAGNLVSSLVDSRLIELSICLFFTSLAGLLAYNFLSPINNLIDHAKRINDDLVGRYVFTGRRDDLGLIELAFKFLEAETAGLIGRVSDTTTSMSSATNILNSAVDEAKQSAAKQFTETEQVVSAINEMVTSIQEVALSAQKSSAAANESLTEVEKGKTVVDTSVGYIEKLKQQIGSSAKVIQELEKSSVSIALVLDVINDIAEQTNLLALNAAIEAARAGDAGRGFAVVADEVRSLANRTHTSTEEIRQVVEKLQQDSQKAVVSMNEGLSSADICSEQGVNTAKTFSAVLSAIEQIHIMSTQIAAAVEQQSAVSEDINRSIHAIRDASERSLDGANQCATISDDINNSFVAFALLVGQFWEKQNISI